MTSESIAPSNLRDTLRRSVQMILAALVTGVADPPPRRAEWPAWLRWTRRIGLGRLPFWTATVLLDAIIALSTFGGTVSLLRTEVLFRDPGYSDNLLLLASAALALPIALRGLHPVAAWRISFLAMAWTASRHWLDAPYVPGGVFAILLCLYSVAVRSPREVTMGVGTISIVAVVIADRGTAFGAAVLILVPLLFGFLVKQRRNTSHELAEQERRHRDTEAVLTERQRIARELHDVVAHHMSMIAIQAEAAPYRVREVPDQTRADLAEIRATALEALTEMRRVLGVLRSEDGVDTAPQPSLERFDELIANARATGLTVHSDVRGDPVSLPPGVGLTAFRIVQEGLSNAMRHAPGSTVHIRVERTADTLALSVVNGPPADGRRPAPGPSGQGHGLVGMRERAAMLGGEFSADPTPEGGFAVTASIPAKGSR